MFANVSILSTKQALTRSLVLAIVQLYFKLQHIVQIEQKRKLYCQKCSLHLKNCQEFSECSCENLQSNYSSSRECLTINDKTSHL